MTSDLLGRYGLDPRLVEWFEAADHGQCHCGKAGIYVEQKANTWIWYCAEHRPDFRACHICGQPGVAFEHVAERWLWYCRAHADGRRGQCSEANPAKDLPHSDRSDPERVCICGLPGVYSRPRKPDKDGKRGRSIWRCGEHRDLTMTTIGTDYDPTLRRDLLESFDRARIDLAPNGGREVIDACLDLMVLAMIHEFGVRDPDVIGPFLYELRCAIVRARRGDDSTLALGPLNAKPNR